MRMIIKLVDAFIHTVGITPPEPSMRHRATLFIAVGLFGTAAGIIGFLLFALRNATSHR